jgi:hypothetical protein
MTASRLVELLTTYRKEVTLIVVTATATLLSTKVLPALGSVLKQIAAYGWAVCSGRGKEYRFLRKYLQWVVNEHRYSPVIPSQMLDPQKLPKVPRLEHVYIRLQLRSSGGEQLEVPAQSLLHPGSRTVVLGDPGAGKTTYLRYLTLIQANGRLSSILHLRARRRLREQIGTEVRGFRSSFPSTGCIETAPKCLGISSASLSGRSPISCGENAPISFLKSCSKAAMW